ncbi:hypothetical protein XH97_08125 [Bradyrhizobium sp. CCBAU 53380]|nr:hypothetical protein [Bradyrhizobium sp. CCBAU 53380]
MPGIACPWRNYLAANDLVPCPYFQSTEPPMASLLADDSEQIDRRTSRSICDAVGERLQQSLRPEPRLPTHLEQLLDELRQREREPH